MVMPVHFDTEELKDLRQLLPPWWNIMAGTVLNVTHKSHHSNQTIQRPIIRTQDGNFLVKVKMLLCSLVRAKI